MIKWPAIFHRKEKKYCPDANERLQKAHDANRKKAKELAEELDQTVTNFTKRRVKHS